MDINEFMLYLEWSDSVLAHELNVGLVIVNGELVNLLFQTDACSVRTDNDGFSIKSVEDGILSTVSVL